MMKNIILLMLCAVIISSCTKEKDIYPATDSDQANINSFRLVTETGINAIASVNIKAETREVTVKTNAGIALTRLFPSASVSEGAIVQPALGVYTDFTNPVTYTVIAGDRQNKKEWTVRVSP